MMRYYLLFVLIVFALGIGFYQEKLKVSINYLLDESAAIPDFYQLTAEQKMTVMEAQRKFAPFDYYHNHKTISWLYHLDYAGLKRMKWIVTGVFLLVFFLINAAVLRVFFGSFRTVKWLAYLYVALIALAVAVFFIGHMSGWEKQGYAISRKITGALQSLIPVMIFVPALWLLKTERIYEKNG